MSNNVIRVPDDVDTTFMQMFDDIDPIITNLQDAVAGGDAVSLKAAKIEVESIMAQYSCEPSDTLTAEQQKELADDFVELQQMFKLLVTSLISKAKILFKYSKHKGK